MAKKEKHDPVTKEVANVPVVPASSELSVRDILTDEGMGLENIGAADIALPFLMVLQSGSPQVKRGEAQIEDATEGDVFNTVTQEVYNGEEGIFVVPCLYKKSFVEWRPRESGGGFVNQYDSEEILSKTKRTPKGQDMLDNGNIIVATAYHYVLLVDPITGDYQRAVIGMSSTQLKKSRRWNSLMTGLKISRPDGTKFTPAMFSHMYRMTTVPEANELGAWSGWHIELYGMVPTTEIYQAAKKFASDLKQGLIREATPPSTEVDGNVPF